MTLRALAFEHFGKPASAENGIKMIDSLIAAYDPEESSKGLYLEVNPENEPPPNHLIVPLCDSCRVMAVSEAGNIDGFIIVFP